MKNSISFRDHAVHGIKLLACLAVLTASAWAEAASGTFTYVTGGVFVETQGRRVPATRGMEVNSGDLVVTTADGMAQLSMVDQAKLSLRFNSQLRIESYPSTATGQESATLSLLRGTLRTFTGLLTPTNREKYLMKTRVATVGIRGSGNILNHEEDNGVPVTINHTIEGSHISWDDCREEFADLIIDTVNGFAPNFRASVLARQIHSPLDLERKFGLIGGDIFHGALSLDQLFSARPVLGYGNYRTPVGGLYQCGAGTHPGGGVTGIPGHNAAREILKDR